MDNLLRYPVATPPEPGCTEAIAPGIRWLRMPLPFALDHINLWLIEDGDGWTIVDAGYAMPETQALWARIFAEQLGGKPVRRVVVTHYHPDHIGLADWLCRRWRAPLWTTEKEWLHARMLSRDPDDGELERVGRAFALRAGLDAETSDAFAVRHWSYRRGVPSVPSLFHRLSDGMTFPIGGRHWRVLVGEGHAPELACLYCAEIDVLIAGDQVLPRISPNISVSPFEPDGNPLAQFLGSLAKLKAIVPDTALVLPSHNLPFFGLHQRIDELAAHHEDRCEAVVAACATPKTAGDLLPVLFRRKLDAQQTGFAIGEALAHLHLLMDRGAIARLPREAEPDPQAGDAVPPRPDLYVSARR